MFQGHTVGNALTGAFSGGSSDAQSQSAQPPPAVAPNAPMEPTGPCAWEIKQFLQCAQNQSDLSLCSGFNEAIRQCKTTHGKCIQSLSIIYFQIYKYIYIFCVKLKICMCFFPTKVKD